jgi:hypothetical protein
MRTGEPQGGTGLQPLEPLLIAREVEEGKESVGRGIRTSSSLSHETRAKQDVRRKDRVITHQF